MSILCRVVLILLFPLSVLGNVHPELDRIATGAEQLDLYLPRLQNTRVAIVANQTSMVDKTHLVDTLLSLNIQIQKIFAPEHGFRGSADAGEHVKDGIDVKTGLPIISLYGSNKKPKLNDLENIDVILFDIQDVGVRFYTYISTLHYIMEACEEKAIKLIVLDRPNPNGFYVDGPVLKNEFKSFVGMHEVPLVHGMTIGEYAQMINGEKWLSNGEQCDLEIIKCANYTHDSLYSLPLRPSPNLKSDASIFLYPSLGLFEGTIVSVGRGTPTPFEIIGYPGCKEGDFSFTPISMDGAKNPKHLNVECKGYNLKEFAETELLQKKEIYLTWLIEMYKEYKGEEAFFNREKFFDLLAGSSLLREQIMANMSEDTIRISWKEDLDTFLLIRKKYLLYPDFTASAVRMPKN